jgi:nitroreductase
MFDVFAQYIRWQAALTEAEIEVLRAQCGAEAAQMAILAARRRNLAALPVQLGRDIYHLFHPVNSYHPLRLKSLSAVAERSPRALAPLLTTGRISYSGIGFSLCVRL